MAVSVAANRHTDTQREVKQELRLVTAIDVGTTKVCAIVGRAGAVGGVEILAHSTVPCEGLRKGNVYDVAVTAKAVRSAADEIEAASGLRLHSAYVGITGAHVTFQNRKEELASVGASGVITADELNAPPSESSAKRKGPSRKTIHALTMAYTLDGEQGIRNPTGMHSRKVEVETHVVTAGASYINKLSAAIEAAGIKVDGLVLEPLASGMAVLTADERQRGAVVVDIGGGTTDLVGFKNGRICYTGVIPVGGYQFTNDIAVTYNTPYSVAEAVKLNHAHTEIPTGRNENQIALPVVGKDEELLVWPMDICRLTRERALELIRLVGIKMSESGMTGSPMMNVVLSGGASNLPGLGDLMQRRLHVRVRQGVPDGRWPIPKELKDPTYATGVGILLWGASQPRGNGTTPQPIQGRAEEARRPGILSSLLRGIKRLSPISIFGGNK